MSRSSERESAGEGTVQAEHLVQLFALAQDMLCVVGTDGHFKLVNPAWQATLGYTPDELLARSLADLVHPVDLEATRLELERLAGGQSTTDFRNRYQHRDGTWRWLSWRSTAVPERGLIYAVARDVTDQMALEAAAERYARELERSNTELDEFAYVASHDLRSPLRDIHNLAGWIIEDVGESLPPDSSRHLATLRQRIERMEELLDRLLEYSRVGRRDSEPAEVDVPALVTAIVDSAGAPPGFTLAVAVGVARVTTPRLPLEQVIRNLVDNAIKHHDRDRGRIAVHVEPRSAALELVVTDDGPGIAPEHREKVFGMFQTLRPRDQVEGSGMGLALVRKIVASRGGTVDIESAPERGTRVRVIWPVEPEEQSR